MTCKTSSLLRGITLKIREEHWGLLEKRAKERGCSLGEAMRDILDEEIARSQDDWTQGAVMGIGGR